MIVNAVATIISDYSRIAVTPVGCYITIRIVFYDDEVKYQYRYNWRPAT